MTPESMDRLFHALASAPRRRIMDIVRRHPGSNVTDVCRHFDMTRIAVMKHLAVLEDAGLIVTEKRGRNRRLYFNAVPIQQIYERWTDEYSGMWASRLTEFKRRIEDAG